MKLIILSLFVFFFVVMPMYLLNTLLMPSLQNLQTQYSTAGAQADRIAAATTAATR